MDFPKVSVVMSVFNGEAFLPEAIESILAQSYADFEFVIIDDGSTDETPEILASHANRDSRIHILRHKNKGRALSLNDGISFARGRYIARMDADDVALPHRLEQQLAFMEEHPEVGLLGGAADLISPTGVVIRTVSPPQTDTEIRSLMLRHNTMLHPTVVMRKEVFLSAGGYRKALLDADDYDLWLRMGERSQLANIAETMLRYRIHANQSSVRNMEHQVLCGLAARAAASQRRSGHPDPLSEVREITRELLGTFGVTKKEIEESLFFAYSDWIDLLSKSQPDAAIGAIDRLSQMSAHGKIEKQVLANTLLAAAGIYYRQSRPIRALLSAGRAILIRPIVTGRPIKRLISRFVDALGLFATRS